MQQAEKWKRARTWILATAILLAGAAAVRAHEGHEHESKGTIQAIADSTLTLATIEGKTLELSYDGQTKFVRATRAVKPSDVSPGERAVVRYHEMSGKLHALEVKLADKKP